MKYYNIAGLNLAVNGVDYEYFDSRMWDYQVYDVIHPDITVNFELNNSIDIKKYELPQSFLTKRGRHYFDDDNISGFYDYIIESDKTVSLMMTNQDWTDYSYIFSDLTNIFGIEPGINVVNVLGHLFANGIKNYDGAVIHASTIMYNDKAVTFTAASGTGKSTHTGLWKQYYPQTVIINDDMPAIRFTDGKFYAYGTPWAGKTFINKNIRAPLHAMVFIERADECSIEELSPVEAVFRMFKEVPVSVYKKQTDLLVDFFDRLFKTVPSYLLKCDISKDAVDVVKNKLF